MILNKYCTKCKTIKNLAPKPYCVIAQNSGVTRAYFMCRSCNTERILKYRHTKRGALANYRAHVANIKRSPEKQKARLQVYAAVKKGIVERSKICEKCTREVKTDAHHEDYTKPLEIIWLCRQCHADRHNELKVV